MTADDLSLMGRHNGLYILSDERSPGSTFIVVMHGATEDTPGLMHTMRPHQQVSLDAAQWPDTTTFIGGPFDVRSCEAREQEIQLLKDTADFWRGLALKCRPQVTFYRDFMLESSDCSSIPFARQAQAILDSMNEGQECEALWGKEQPV